MAAPAREPKGINGLIHHPSVWLVLPTALLLLGQAMASFAPGISSAAGLLVIAPLFLCLAVKTRRCGLVLFVGAVAFGIGYQRHRQLLDPVFPSNHLRSAMGRAEQLYIEGSLLQEPEKLTTRSRWIIRTERIWHPTGAEEITGNLIVTVRTVGRQWRYGDRVRIRLRPVIPRDSGNPGGFDYARYLARREIYVSGFIDGDQEVELVAREPGALRGYIEDLRRAIRRHIQENLSAANGALLKALVIGDMGEISKEMRGAFTAAGVNHVLSISGLHVAMLGLVVFALIRFGCAWSAYLLLRWNLLKIAAFFSFLAVVFYTALAGAMVPTVRSAIMIGVYEMAVLLDREEEVFTSLALAALLIALVWPGVVADISFQLSFLAVLFIVWGMRKMQAWRAPERGTELPQERKWVREKLRQAAPHLLVPLLATLGTGPLIAHYFGHLSLAGFVANPVIVPLVGFVVVPVGLMVGFLAVVAPQAAPLLVWPAEKFLSLTLWLVDWLAKLPLANIGVPAPNALEVIALYLAIVMLFTLKRNRYALGAFVLVLAGLCADGYYWWQQRWRRTELRVTHLNVGQGDAAVVELPGSKVVLIDAGGTAFGDFDPGESIVAPFLRSRKILKVDYLVVTHPRIDHYGGMRAIAGEFSPSEFWSGAARGRSRRFEELEGTLSSAKIPLLPLNAGEPCRAIAGIAFCTHYAPVGNDNSGSVVLSLEHGKLRYLFASDIDQRDEAVLLRQGEGLRSVVLKVPRHGSTAASSNEFIAAVRPRVAVISAGARGRFEAQRQEVGERYRDIGAEVLRTDHDGAIIIESDGTTIRYRGYKSGKRGVIDTIE
jgi:competence protein ComEC